MEFVTRYAPSPTGLHHLGGARTAYFNYLTAKASGGKFILRIDDTDLERNKSEYICVIMDSLHWLGLIPDQVEQQSHRIGIYQKIALELVTVGLAKELDNGAIALVYASETLPDNFQDTLAGIIPITETNKKQISQVILLRGQKLNNNQFYVDATYKAPTYQFASVVDDYLLSINWIIRGVDHISNTPKQIAIWVALNQLLELSLLKGIPDRDITENSVIFKGLPKFTHVGLIYKDGKKLSKRDDAASLLWYKEQGYSPEVILNFILRMGWGSSKDTGKLISKEQAIDLFMKGSMRSAPSNYDENKLKYLRKIFLRG